MSNENKPYAWHCFWFNEDGKVSWQQFERFQDPKEKEWDDPPQKVIPVYSYPEKHLSLQKVGDELIAVTYTDDEYRIIEVLWEKPPEKRLTDDEKKELWNKCKYSDWDRIYEFADAVLKKAKEK